eukprot:11103849-Alexandrium_andersonii.AAC.1
MPGARAPTASAGSSGAEVLDAFRAKAAAAHPAKLCRALAKAIVARGRRQLPSPSRESEPLGGRSSHREA